MKKPKFLDKIMPHRASSKRSERDGSKVNEEKPVKISRETMQNFARSVIEKEPSGPTKKSHGTKKVQNRARNKRSRSSRKVNR